jgi:hypothetical protein
MTDVQVVSANSTPPSIIPPFSLFAQLYAWIAAILGAGVFLKLFNNDIIVSAATPLTALTESVAPGYAPVPVTAIDGPYLDQSGNAYAVTPLEVFTCTGGGSDLIYGCYLVEVSGAAATATFTEAGGAYTAPVITSGGSGYLVPPRVTPTGATGSGAILTATITNGVVTGITIVNGGTGYTTATVEIEPPLNLIEVANFPLPLPLQKNTDSIPVVVQLDNPS